MNFKVEVEGPFGGLFVAKIVDEKKLAEGVRKYYPDYDRALLAIKEYARSWIEWYTASGERLDLGAEIKLIPERTPLPEFLGLEIECVVPMGISTDDYSMCVDLVENECDALVHELSARNAQWPQ